MGMFYIPRRLFEGWWSEEPSRPGQPLFGRGWPLLSQPCARPRTKEASSVPGERIKDWKEGNKKSKNDEQKLYKGNDTNNNKNNSNTTTEAGTSLAAEIASSLLISQAIRDSRSDCASGAVAGGIHGEADLDPALASGLQTGQASTRQSSSIRTSSLNPKAPLTALTPSFSFSSPPPPSSPSQSQTQPTTTMAESEVRSLISQLDKTVKAIKPVKANHNVNDETRNDISKLLSRAKHALLQLDALIPGPSTPTSSLTLAREILELSALLCILMQEPAAFTRCVTQLQPFYELPASRLPTDGSRRSQVMGLYLLLLLSQGDYAGFHTLLEGLEVAARGAAVMEEEEGKEGGGDAKMRGAGDGREGRAKDNPLEDDEFIQYPIRLEQALMEGSYDRVWGETKDERVPSEEYKVFSDVLVGTIRSEIASCSERAYASLPITNAKNLLFLDSEGAVVQFANERGWTVRDGRIYFPQDQAEDGSDVAGLGGAAASGANGVGGVGAGAGYLSERDGILAASKQVIDNTISYARELETIV